MPQTPRSRLGTMAERRARAYLEARGLRYRAGNFRTRHGEIDLVMDDGETVVFIEVRYRGGGARVGAAESVDAAKQRRIATAAAQYLRRDREASERACRFDVVAISAAGAQDEIQWIERAFEAW